MTQEEAYESQVIRQVQEEATEAQTQRFQAELERVKKYGGKKLKWIEKVIRHSKTLG